MNEKKDFPETLHDAIKYFSDPDIALNFVVSMRWPDGVKCPHCGSSHVSFAAKRKKWTCEDCPTRRQFSVKVGTIMEDSPIGLDKWLAGMWLVASAKNGISSHELHRALGITQKSAWFLGHRIRFALMNGSFDKMQGNLCENEPSELTLADRFRHLAIRWKSERKPMSSIRRLTDHPAYQEIIEMGKPAVPLILAELEREPDHWFVALNKITKADPVPKKDRGDLLKMAEAWLDWGKK